MSYRTLDLLDLADELSDLQDQIDLAEEDGNDPDLSDDEKERYEDLKKLEKEVGGDFYLAAKNEPTLIAEDDFDDYVKELAAECGPKVDYNSRPFNCIDWE